MNHDDINPFRVKAFANIYQKTLVKLSIVDSLYNTNNVTYLTNIFQAFINDLNNYESMQALKLKINNTLELTNNKNQRKELLNINDEQKYVSESLKKEIEQISLKEQEIDRVIENCNERYQGDLIMRGMEKLYVKKWEKARIEYFKIKHVSEEFELSRLTENTKRRMETEEMIDNESLSFIKHSIFELNEQLKYWKLKYDNDIVEINEKLNKLLQLLKTKKYEESLISFTFYKRQAIIDEYERIQIQLEQDKKNAEHKENMIIKIQAWWRGTMVRRRLGPYKQMLSLRKKSIKKMTSKGKNHKM